MKEWQKVKENFGDVLSVFFQFTKIQYACTTKMHSLNIYLGRFTVGAAF